MKALDINADVGESFGRWRLGDDDGLLRYVTSANVAAGFHAGDPSTMAAVVRVAKRLGVQVGAHPGLPDLLGFGRRGMAITPDEAADYCLYQLGALTAIAAREDVPVRYVKPHGALYGLAAKEPSIAAAIAEAIRSTDPGLYLLLMDGPGAASAEQSGIRVLREAFVDVDYREDGSLIIERVKTERDPEEVAERAVRVARGSITTLSGRELPVIADSICIHGDVGNAVSVARRVRERLDAEGIPVSAMDPHGSARPRLDVTSHRIWRPSWPGDADPMLGRDRPGACRRPSGQIGYEGPMRSVPARSSGGRGAGDGDRRPPHRLVLMENEEPSS